MKRTSVTTRTWIAAAALCCSALLSACGGGDDDEQRQQQQQRTATVEAVNARLQTLHAQMPASPGIVVQVLDRRSGLAWAGSVGLADRASGRPLTPEVTFRTASLTKVFTAAAVFRLVEHGFVATADPIERHLSAASLATLRAGGYDPAGITVDHLLAHRAGLPDHALSLPYFEAVLMDPTHRWSRDEQLAFAMTLGGPLFAPGSDYRYSDTGYLLLGEVIERHTGMQLGAAVRSLLRLASLGVASTYQESVDEVPAAAGPRAKQDLLPGIDDSMVDASVDLWGAGGLVADARDLALFVRALVEGRVLGPAAQQAMFAVASQIAGAPGAAGEMAYARGILRVRVQGDTCWGHDAFSGAFMLHCPASGITVAGSLAASTLTGAPEAIEMALDLVRTVASVQ
jgi:D-alanyl-D-alanine carboxypeptidase